ncbi:hypothetical protein [Pseudomonas sp. KBW05]|uniref:hypothetical protein n=1 Tax=Pseudomonas sp. KBW05 TaxID=2153360 RepID=UPI000F595A14|nr:hypothetical protein [Pseudomonas sp. KBW05]
MTPEKKAATVREARLKLQKDVDSGVDTEASKKVLRDSIVASLRGTHRAIWASEFAMKLFPADQETLPSLFEFIEQFEEMIAKDIISLPAEEEDDFTRLDDVTAMYRI